MTDQMLLCVALYSHLLTVLYENNHVRIIELSKINLTAYFVALQYVI